MILMNKLHATSWIYRLIAKSLLQNVCLVDYEVPLGEKPTFHFPIHWKVHLSRKIRIKKMNFPNFQEIWSFHFPINWKVHLSRKIQIKKMNFPNFQEIWSFHFPIHWKVHISRKIRIKKMNFPNFQEIGSLLFLYYYVRMFTQDSLFRVKALFHFHFHFPFSNSLESSYFPEKCSQKRWTFLTFRKYDLSIFHSLESSYFPDNF